MTHPPSSQRSHWSLVVLVVLASTVYSWTAAATDCTNLSDGTVCADGNACTVGETCRAGSCLPPVSFAQAAGSPVAVGNTPYAVASGDVNGDGKLDLAVANYVTNDVTILLGNGSGGFSQAAGSPVAVGTGPISVAVGDWNVDAKLDLAVANQTSSNVTILLGNGAGGFSPAAGSPVAAGTQSISVAAGDVNGDRRLDLAVAGFLSNDVTILLGNGSGGFSQASGSPVAVGTQPISIKVGDMNGDGRVDLAVANYGSNDVTILLGSGSGGFSPAAGSPVAVGANPHSVVVADVSADGKLDLAVANGTSNSVTILLGNGAGGFSQATGSPVGVGALPAEVVIGDVNGDGRLDLAVVSYGSNSVTILLGTGSGKFSQAAGSPFATSSQPNSLAIGDLNGDGRLDLAAPNSGSGNVTILLSNTAFAVDGTACDDGNACTVGEACRSGNCLAPVSLMQPAGSPVTVGIGPFSVVVGDWNGDGDLDLATAHLGSNQVDILLGNGSGGFSQAGGSPLSVGTDPSSLAAGDLNKDGKLDLAVTGSTGHNVTILLGDGSGGFNPAAGSPFAVGQNPFSVAIGDVNGDAKPDLAVANYLSPSVTILLGNGSGGFNPASGSPITVATGPISVALGDVNGDGKTDVAVASYDSDNVTILLGNGSGGFSQAAGSPIGTGNGPRSVAIADVSGDGRLDLAVASYDDSNVAILLGNGSGGFSQAVGSPFAVGTNPFSVVAGDANGDGKLDLAVANRGADSVTILLGTGTGWFIQASGSPYAAGAQPSSVAAADLNGDGKLDLAVANYNSSNVTIVLGKTCPTGGCSAMSLTQPSGSPVGVGNLPTSIAVGDVNGDGKPDLAVANSNSLAITILLGNGSGGISQAAGSPVAVGTGPVSVAFGGVNGDGKLDLAVANYFSNNVAILLGNGSGGFSQAAGSPVAVGTGPVSVAFGDLNGNGTVDLAVANYGDNTVTILLGNGSGGFSQAAGSPVAVGTNPHSAELGDVNGDGRLDIAVPNGSSDNVTILLGTGSGGFSQAAGSPVAVGAAPASVVFGDVNGDGKLDLAVANYNSGNVTILLGNGSGGFTQATGSPVATGTEPRSVAFGDVDGDGKLDLAVANIASDNVTILLGNGSGGFSQPAGSPVAMGTLSQPSAAAFGDMNGDGMLDLAVANYNASNVAVLLNHTVPAQNGTACDDGDACTAGDVCTAGFCSGTPFTAPAEVDNGVRVQRIGGAAVISWNLAPGATSSAVDSGLLTGLPVGPGGGDEICLASGLPSTTLTWPDGTDPAAGVGFWYLVRGDNACGKGPYGFQAKNGVPTFPRVSTTCP